MKSSALPFSTKRSVPAQSIEIIGPALVASNPKMANAVL
jgi:hypothetical protein